MGIINRQLDEKGLWPTKTQLFLLKAALLDGHEAIHNWTLWRSRININDDFDYDSFRLLPLLYHNMHRLGVEDNLMPRLKGVFRHAWFKNHRLVHEIRPLITKLKAEGFDILLLKGLAMVHCYYQHQALRPMADVDFLVPVNQAESAQAMLRTEGWIDSNQSPNFEDVLKYRHSKQFKKKADHELDLHWHVMEECCNENYDDMFWSRSIDAVIEDIEVKILDPTDLLLHTIIHGIRWNAEPPIRWIPDAMMIFRDDGDKIDWNRLCDDAKSICLSSRLELGLSFLNHNFNLDIPDFVIDRLSKEKVTILERIENNFALQNTDVLFDKFGGKLWVIFCEHQRIARNRLGLPAIKGYFRYLKYRFNVGSNRELLTMFYTGLHKRLSRPTTRKA